MTRQGSGGGRWRAGGGTAGTVAMEFALLGPVTMCIVVLGIALARLFFISVCLQDGVVEAARYGATGDNAVSGLRLNNISTVLNNMAGVPVTLTMTPYADWDSLSAGTTASGMIYGAAGDPGQVVVYSASYTDPLTTNLMGMLRLLPGSSGNAPTMTLTSSTVIQNEPFLGQ